ncbi:hypothetical protein [Paenibacillus sp. S150]|uniref:hypothetical protein n=1 Tax=Paenibacillus sp. S150 TaxID=2749826 RepID=UPI001C5A0A6F|nr:hypothetical protein [Paenibacillus sp. S150]MBW4081449.1 hypothetical protein [Paenibacillus sp. S150]
MENIAKENADSRVNIKNELIRYEQTASVYMAAKGYSLKIISAVPVPVSASFCPFPSRVNEPSTRTIMTAKVKTRLTNRLALNREEIQLMNEPIIVAAMIGSNGINKIVIRKKGKIMPRDSLL